MAKPFIKWAGGKTQLLEQLDNLLPKDFGQWDGVTYVEPFVGGGAMLFFMLQRYQNINRVIINDINSRLAETYYNVKNNVKELVYNLKEIEQIFNSLEDQERQRAYYLKMRQRFNEEGLLGIERSALMIFLNRTCFNGLYRENSKGLFNVPFGRYTNPTICNEELLYSDSELLNRFDVNVISCDFLEIESFINPQDYTFLYFDPPYRPLNATSSFNSYVKEAFDDERQKELAAFCRKLDQMDRTKWMLSNADCSAKNSKDTFFEELYGGFNIHRVFASRNVNSNASKRGKLTELLITNY